MQSQSVANGEFTPCLVLAGEYRADQLFESLDAFIGTKPTWPPTREIEEAPLERIRLDIRGCTYQHRLADALALVQYLAGRIARLDITVKNEQQAGFGQVLTVLGRTHGLSVSVH